MGHCDDPQNVIFWLCSIFWTLGVYSDDSHYVLFPKIILESLSQENSELTTPEISLIFTSAPDEVNSSDISR